MAINYIYYPKYDATLLIDDEDLDLVTAVNGGWRGNYTGRSGWIINKAGKTHYLHRIIIKRVFGRQLTRDEFVDHLDRNNSNNTRSNLRIANRSENGRNKTATGASKYLGVTWYKTTNKWVTHISVNGKSKTLGYFDDELEAAIAYNRACNLQYPGCPFSALNDTSKGYSNHNRPLECKTRKITKEEYEAQTYEKANAALETTEPSRTEVPRDLADVGPSESFLPY